MDAIDINDWCVTVQAADADECYLIGDFNGWSVPGFRMDRVTPDIWRAVIGPRDQVGRVQGVAMQQGRVVRFVTALVETLHAAQSREAIA